jgi:pimeloyl-ACP methyl ester carboxylesterase
MVDSTHRLVTEGLKVGHLPLVLGSSLGCMHSFLWAETYPELMDLIVGLSCQPVEISGRNWIQWRAAAEAIRHDPDWNNGNYDKNPTHYIYSAAAGSFMPESAARIQEMAPTRAAADKLYDERVAPIAKGDANDSLWAIESIEDYNPEPENQGQGAADQHGGGRGQPARARHGRARNEENPRRPIRADPVQRQDARAFHPLLRRGVEALFGELHGDARPGGYGPVTAGRRSAGGKRIRTAGPTCDRDAD